MNPKCDQIKKTDRSDSERITITSAILGKAGKNKKRKRRRGRMASKRVVYIVSEGEVREGGRVIEVFRELEQARLYVQNYLSKCQKRRTPWEKSDKEGDVWENGVDVVEIVEYDVMEGWEQGFLG